MSDRKDAGTFRTPNIALAAFLSFHVDPAGKKWKEGVCYWLFPQSNGLSALVTSFSGGTASIDPRAYSYKLTTMRKEMWKEETKEHGS
jgi:hypothetical protein